MFMQQSLKIIFINNIRKLHVVTQNKKNNNV